LHCEADHETRQFPFRRAILTFDAVNRLIEIEAGRAERAQRGAHFQFIVEPRRRQIIHLATAHGERQTVLFHQSALRDAEIAQHLRARPFRKLQIVGVIDDTARVGVLVIHAH